MTAVGVLAWAAGSFGTDALVESMGGSLTRRHVAVWLNVIDLGGRGAVVLSLGALVANQVRGRVKKALLIIGRGSLVAYVFHIPFCYGALGRPIAGRLDMAESTALTALLIARTGVPFDHGRSG